MTIFIDVDHGSNILNRRSHTGYIMYMIIALMVYFSKKQNTVEASTYGLELLAMRIVRDRIVEMMINCKNIYFPLFGATEVYWDNQGVVMNTSIPGST